MDIIQNKDILKEPKLNIKKILRFLLPELREIIYKYLYRPYKSIYSHTLFEEYAKTKDFNVLIDVVLNNEYKRYKTKKLFNSIINNPGLSDKLEKECFIKSLEGFSTIRWNIRFVQKYQSRISLVYSNMLNIDKKNIENIIRTKEIGKMKEKDIDPDANMHILGELITKKKICVKKKTSQHFSCKYCHKYTIIFETVQKRSIDEMATTVARCQNEICGKIYNFG